MKMIVLLFQLIGSFFLAACKNIFYSIHTTDCTWEREKVFILSKSLLKCYEILNVLRGIAFF